MKITGKSSKLIHSFFSDRNNVNFYKLTSIFIISCIPSGLTVLIGYGSTSDREGKYRTS
jgi:hypothetical protein